MKTTLTVDIKIGEDKLGIDFIENYLALTGDIVGNARIITYESKGEIVYDVINIDINIDEKLTKMFNESFGAKLKEKLLVINRERKRREKDIEKRKKLITELEELPDVKKYLELISHD